LTTWPIPFRQEAHPPEREAARPQPCPQGPAQDRGQGVQLAADRRQARRRGRPAVEEGRVPAGQDRGQAHDPQEHGRPQREPAGPEAERPAAKKTTAGAGTTGAKA
jgi:hypothetical protein